MEEYLVWDGLGATVRICLSGSEIPEWFSYQNEGSTVTIELPPNWCSSKFVGFGLCIVVAFDDYYDYSSFDVECICKFETIDGDCNEFDVTLNGLDPGQKPKSLCSDHLFLLYSHRMCAMVVQGDNEDHRFSTYQSCHKASFEFSPQDQDQWLLLNCKVKKCGIRLLYSEEECTDNSNDTHRLELPSDGNSTDQEEEEEDPSSNRLKEIEPNWLAQSRIKLMVLLVGLVLFFFWCLH
ncbi:hypothetical protein ACOSQ2_032207 [Xanthoceras sorbifolium]